MAFVVFQSKLAPLNLLSAPLTWLQLNFDLSSFLVLYWCSVVLSGYSNNGLLLLCFISRAHLDELHQSLSLSTLARLSAYCRRLSLFFFYHTQIYRNIALSKDFLMGQLNWQMFFALPMNVYVIGLLLNCSLSSYNRNVLLFVWLLQMSVFRIFFALIRVTQAFYQSTGRLCSLQASLNYFLHFKGVNQRQKGTFKKGDIYKIIQFFS